MKKLLQLFLFLLFFSGCFTSAHIPFAYTDTQFKGRYSKFLTSGETEVNSWFHYMTSITPEGKYVVRMFFPETQQITSLVTYKTKNVKVLHGLCESISNECKRVVAGIPDWAPGMRYGESVNVWFNLPIMFRLE